jgi:hypothetical protein
MTETTAIPPARRQLKVFAWLGGIAIVALALWTLRGQWRDATTLAASLRPAWGGVAWSSAIVLLAYGVLIWTWRECLRDAGTRLGTADAVRLWFVSNLARYIPGAFWQVGALALLARQVGASATAATSAAIALTVVNTLCGVILVVVLGAGLLGGWRFSPLQPLVAIVALVLLRWAGPRSIAFIAARTGRTVQLPALGPRMLAASIGGSAVSWLLYGLAFQQLVSAILPGVDLQLQSAVAIYTAAYLAGFLSLGPPAGLGVADGALVALLVSTGSATAGEAAVIATVTRLWRTVLEVLPGLGLLAIQASRGKRIP